MIEIRIQFDDMDGSWGWQTPQSPVVTLGLIELFKKIYIDKNVQNKVYQPSAQDLAKLIKD